MCAGSVSRVKYKELCKEKYFDFLNKIVYFFCCVLGTTFHKSMKKIKIKK